MKDSQYQRDVEASLDRTAAGIQHFSEFNHRSIKRLGDAISAAASA